MLKSIKFTLVDFLIKLRIPWFVYLGLRIPWLVYLGLRIPLTAIPRKARRVNCHAVVLYNYNNMDVGY